MEFQHELIIPNEGLPFKLFLFEGGNGNYEREKHWHTSIEIFAVLKGRLTFFLNEEEYPLEAGGLVIINSNEIHSIHAPDKNETVVLQIPLKQFERYFTAQRFIRFTSAARIARDKNSEEPDNRKLAFFIEELYKVYQKKAEGWEYRTMALYYNILYLLVRDYRETEAAQAPSGCIVKNYHLYEGTLQGRTEIVRHGCTFWIFGCILVTNVQKVCKNQF